MEATASLDQVTRQLNFDFHSLPFTAKLRIALDLGLVRDSDCSLSSFALLANIPERAFKAGKLERLQNRVNTEKELRKI